MMYAHRAPAAPATSAPHPPPNFHERNYIPQSSGTNENQAHSQTVVAPVKQGSQVMASEDTLEPARPKFQESKSGLSLWKSKKEKSNKMNRNTEGLITETSSNTNAPQTAPKTEKSPFKIKVPDSLRGMTNLGEVEIDILSGGDISIVSDTKKKERKEGLCTACSKIDFEQFNHQAQQNKVPRATGGEKFTRKLIFLDRILRKKKNNSCHFCSLLFDAISENDPFKHPAIKDHLDKDMREMTFRKWAEGLNFMQHVPLYKKSAYPFGRSRDSVDLKQEVDGQDVVVKGSTNNDQLTSNDAIQGAGIATAVGVNAAMWNETDMERVKIMATVGTLIPTVTSLMTSLDAKLPVAVSIIIHNADDEDAGLMNVDVWGYGNAHRAPLSRISTFNLRIASAYQTSPDGALSYGKILQRGIDVEGDCRGWLENCFRYHGKSCDEPGWCRGLEPPSGPHFRLIDVHSMRVVQKDMLALNGYEEPPYAALSYVWGDTGRQCLNLKVHNLRDLESHIEGQPLPIARTIRDAIDVTGRIGLRYLWVDSLCIIQYDDRNGDDPEARSSQILQMDRIFGHAAITIVAADGLDAQAGLPGISSWPERTQVAKEVQPNINVLLAVQYQDTFGKWDTRAWTLQEKLLSKRMLIFNGGYTSFHCRHGVLREDMPGRHAGNGPSQIPWVSLPDKKPESMVKYNWDGTPVLLRSPFFNEYANLLAQYTSRDMTDSRDALNAIMGLLKVLEKMTYVDRPVSRIEGAPGSTKASSTLHGLPEEFLDLALLWQPPATEGVHLTKRPHDDLPSWSWTGWEVSKDLNFRPTKAQDFHAKPGVRFEEPFLVSANMDLTLKKVLPSKEAKLRAEERFKPLVMWYKCCGSEGGLMTLVPVNGHGLGIAFGPADTDVLQRFRDEAKRFRSDSSLPIEPRPPRVKHDLPINDRHLVCETQLASFRLRATTSPRKEILWTQKEEKAKTSLQVDTTLLIHEVEILGADNSVVGRFIPTDPRRGLASGDNDFILLSESQYWGDEERVDVQGLPLYNVMLVEWDTRREFATRLGVGKIKKEAWWKARVEKKVVVLK